MTFSPPYEQIFIEFFNFCKYFSNSACCWLWEPVGSIEFNSVICMLVTQAVYRMVYVYAIHIQYIGWYMYYVYAIHIQYIGWYMFTAASTVT